MATETRLIRRAAHDLTLRQYADGIMRRYYGDNPDSEVTRAEYREFYPVESRADDWLEAVRLACVTGLPVRREVLDDVGRRFPRVALGLRHDWPFAFPIGWRLPSAR